MGESEVEDVLGDIFVRFVIEQRMRLFLPGDGLHGKCIFSYGLGSVHDDKV